MNINDIDLNRLIELITLRTGIIPRESHKSGIKTYVEKRLDTLKSSFSAYYMLVEKNHDEFSDLINESTVNETYFFREEKQFQFLRDKIFIPWTSKTGNSQIKIWSAACSTGEEAYSMLLLAKACNLRPSIVASDINTDVLDKCSKGVFKPGSIRNVDGGMFKALLEPYKKSDGSFVFPGDLCSQIKTQEINLAELAENKIPFDIPQNQNIIFIRNVFIYFSFELRAKILKFLADKCLAKDGYLFVSMSEIAQIDNSIMPSSLEKIADNNVFCFHKK